MYNCFVFRELGSQKLLWYYFSFLYWKVGDLVICPNLLKMSDFTLEEDFRNMKMKF